MRIVVLHASTAVVRGLGLNFTQAHNCNKKLAASTEEWFCPNCCGDSALPPFNSVCAVDVFHFDFQKNLPTCPKFTVGKQFYMRLYTMDVPLQDILRLK